MSQKNMDKCTAFLKANGWKFTFNEDDYDYYDKDGCFTVGLCSKDGEITFFDDSGDILTLSANFYSLLGFLFHHRQIACNYSMENVY